MIFYYPDPVELLTDMATKRQQVRLKLPSGGHILGEVVDVDQVRVLQVVSTDPQDYLYANYQPGKVVTLELSIKQA